MGVTPSHQANGELVLVGAGHAHVEVLRRAPELLSAVGITVIAPHDRAWYSGMMPGCVAGLYRPAELQVPLAPLIARAGARYVRDRATRVDAAAGLVHRAGGAPLRFDRCAIDVGSVTAPVPVAGGEGRVVRTRPIESLIGRLEDLERELAGARRIRAVVVGGGAAGIELAFAIRARWHRRFARLEVLLLDHRERPFAERDRRTALLVARCLRNRDVAVRPGTAVAAVEDAGVRLDGGGRIAADAVLLATGAAPPPLAEPSDLATSAAGYLAIDAHLRCRDHERVFATGDCAQNDDAPIPRAGVYAVRQGPVLARNLAASFAGRPLRTYRPQGHFLALLMTGDGAAIASRPRLTWHGR